MIATSVVIILSDRKLINMTRKKLVQQYEKFLSDCEEYRSVLLSSTNAVGDVTRNTAMLRNQQKELITQEAALGPSLTKLSRQPRFRDPMHGVVYSAYDNAFTNDVLIRAGRSLDAVIDDVVYIIARLRNMEDEDYDKLFPTSAKKKDITPGTAFDFWQLVHPEIVEIAQTRYNSGHFADGVEAAFKHINNRVKSVHKQKTGRELDGSSLMKSAISSTSPTLVIDTLDTETGKNMQIGYMEILSGSMTGIRNPKAHDNITITNIEAQRFLIMASLLLYKIDEAKLAS